MSYMMAGQPSELERLRLLALVRESELVRLLEAAKAELADSRRWGTTFTLVQAWARVP